MVDFRYNMSVLNRRFLRGSNSSFAGGKIYGLLRDSGKFGILVKNFNNKIVIITNKNNAQIT